ncbi:MAG TPA: tetratricopeptide repeat protein [Planctomycetota bacterium]|nr:tetratricopeptide repeat protein [Planctomycetota bacterium]HRR79968.1 tetratricopeptide repeat protein [Planctomycetota bacterium]
MSSRAWAARAALGSLLAAAAVQAASLSPRRVERALARAQALADRDRPEDAIDKLRDLLETNPHCLQAHLLYIRLRSPTARAVVQKEYERKVNAEPEDAQLQFLAGYAEDDPAARLRRYRKAVELDPDLVAAQLELGRLYRTDAARDLAASRRALEMAASVEPERAEVHLELARTLAAAGRPGDAAEACRRALRLDRALEPAWFELACLLSRDEPAEAERTLAEAVRRCPASARLWWHLADFQWARAAWREAVPSLERVLALDPEGPRTPEARDRLAACCLACGWHRTARRLGTTAWSAAAAEMAAGRLGAEAFRHFLEASRLPPAARVAPLQQADGLAPESFVIRSALADSLFAAGRFAPAAEIYAGALASRPTDAALRRRAAEAELLAGRPAAALALLRAASRRLAHETLWLLADAEALAAGQLPLEAIAARCAAHAAPDAGLDERERRLRACIERFPTCLTARLELAAALRDAGRTADARAVLAEAASAQGHPLAEADLQAQLGDLALAERNYPRAVACYRAAIERCPETAAYHGALAAACARNGDYAGACDALARQLALDPASYDLPDSPGPGTGPGHLLLPKLEPGDVLRYRYSTDGGQPGRAFACVDFDYVVSAVRPGHVVEGTVGIAAISGRPVEGGASFVGARLRVLSTGYFGLAAVDRPPEGMPPELAQLAWLVQFLHGPALPLLRRPGQAWRPAPPVDPTRPGVDRVAFESVRNGKARLSLEIRHVRPAADPVADLDRATATGRLAVTLDLKRRAVECVEGSLNEALSNRRGSQAELPAWRHRLELLAIERAARKPASPSRP